MHRDIWEIRLDRIHPNLRLLFPLESIRELCHSIMTDGQREPIETWFDGQRLRILDGEKRWRSCKMLGMVWIKAVIREMESQISSGPID